LVPGKPEVVRMKRWLHRSGISRRSVLTTVAALPILSSPLIRSSARAQGADPLPSWKEGAAKQPIIAFVQATSNTSSSKFVPENESFYWKARPADVHEVRKRRRRQLHADRIFSKPTVQIG